MRKRDAERLLQALHSPIAVRIRERTSEWLLYGYVVGLSDAFVLVHRVDPDLICFNGYAALPLREISAVLLDSENALFHRALKLKRLEPVHQPDILLLDFPGLLSSADAHFPLVAIETARVQPNYRYFGRVAKLSKKSLTLREINPSAQWNHIRKYRFKDITRITFGDGYADALWRVSEYEKESPKPHGNS